MSSYSFGLLKPFVSFLYTFLYNTIDFYILLNYTVVSSLITTVRVGNLDGETIHNPLNRLPLPL